MKKLICLALALALLLSLGVPAIADTGGEEHVIEQRTIPTYISTEQTVIDLPWYILDGEEEILWADMDTWASLYPLLASEPGWQITGQGEGSIYTLTRENGMTMTLDFDKDTIRFLDYNYFLQSPSENGITLIEVLASSSMGFDAEGNPYLFQRQEDASFNRPGEELEFDLGAYGIDLIEQDGVYYVPLNTLVDIMLTPKTQYFLLYNTEAAFLVSSSSLGDTDNPTALADIYYSVEPRERSEACIRYSYGELCMILDHFYGQKSSHQIDSFNTIFHNMAFDEALKSPDAAYADAALKAFIRIYMDDSHSGFLMPSWMGGQDPKYQINQYGKSSERLGNSFDRWLNARAAAYPDGVPGYEEVGNTAYITFDSFVYMPYYDYYGTPEEELAGLDTVGLITYAHKMITRENSPIENVVMDLSCNGGGMADAAVFAIGWFLGEAEICFSDKSTGAQSIIVYRTDANLNREFGEEDTLDGLNLYCLISPCSFSCGNLVPAAFKSSQRVTLIGRTSGGGSSEVMFTSTAWGSTYRISGPKNLSLMKNGSMYDIDQGVEPDFYLSKLSSFYDREKLTQIINDMA